MKKNILFLAFVLASVVSFAQFSNYTNINGRYKWIAGKFDSTFTIPTGSTPSLRTGGANAPGAMFYRTTDSTIYQYTGTQWIKLRGGISPTDTAGLWITNLYRRNGTDSVFYVKGGSHTFAFRDSVGNAGGGGGGGKIYYFNGGVSMGTIGGLTMYELGDTANTGAAANFTRATTGNLANFITDPGKPGLLQIPAGVWTVDAYLSETGGGANHAQIWIEVEKWDGSTITTIATSPIEEITNGSVIDLYTWSVSIPTTSLAITDRIVIQFYISNTNGKTVTLYTQNGYVGEVHTTFTTGIGSLNGLTAPSQFFATGTSGTDFNISSSTATHTFNLPTASATNRGALSTTDWSTFNNKIGGSGTTNYVAKFTGTNAVGNSQIFDNGTNVGIGTISGGAKLEIYDASTNSILRFNSGTNNSLRGLEWYNNNTSNIYGSIKSDYTSGVFTYDAGASVYAGTHVFRIGTGGEAMRLDASGNLGLGTSSPGAKLDVAGNSAELIRISSTATNGSYLGFRNSGTLNGAIGTGSNIISGLTNSDLGLWTTGVMVFQTNGSERMRLDASGNLGLGTTATGGARLYVNGASLSSVFDNTTGVYSRWKYNGGNVGIIGTANQIIGGASNTGFALGTESNDYVLFVTNNAERMRLDASGNLGLGVTPSAWSVVGPVFQVNKASFYGYVNQARVGANGYFDGSSFKYIATDFATEYRQNSGEHQWYTAPSGTAGNAISFTQAMTLDASGRLGIGTSSPDVILHVSGTTGTAKIASTSTTAANYPYLTFLHAGNDEFRIGGGDGLRFLSSGTTERMRITSGGLVGIGTSSPAALFTVAATGSDPVLISNSGASSYNSLILSNNNNFKIAIGIGGGSVGGNLQDNGYVGTISNRDLLFNTNNTERMRITSGGNVGIGVTPSAWTVFNPILQIKTGSLAGSGTANFRMFANTYYDGSYKYIGTGTATQYEQDGYHAWYTAPSGTAGNVISFSERMRITSDGEVLIGTTTDAGLFKLQVDGNIYGSGLIQILGSIETGNPNGGTSKRWKLGSKVAASVSFDPDNYIEVDLNGTLYKLALAQ